LVITNVDVQSVEPVDAQTRESLQKSVTLAIEITTKSQEAESQHQVRLIWAHSYIVVTEQLQFVLVWSVNAG